MPKTEPPAEAPAPIEPPAKLSIYEALPLITADVKSVGKNNKNKDQGYAFRGIDDVVQMLHNLFPKYGVGIIPKVTKVTQEVVTSAKGAKGWHTVVEMDYKMTARDGSFEIGSGVGESTAYDDKGIAKAQSMCFKYFLVHGFTIPTNEMLDNEADPQGDEPMRPEADPFVPGATSAHEPAPDPDRRRSGPRPPSANAGPFPAHQSGGLDGSKIPGLRKLSPARDATPAADLPEPEGGMDQWQLEDLRAVPAVSGKPLGEASEKQLRQIVSMGDEYVAHGQKTGKGDVALRAVTAAKLLLSYAAAKAQTPEEDVI